VGYGDLADSLLQSSGMLRVGPCRGRVLLYLMEPVVEMGDMETWLQWPTDFSSLGECSDRSLQGESAFVPDEASCGDVGYGDLANSLLQPRGVLRVGPCRGRAFVPDGASGGDVGYGDLANSLLQTRGGLWRGRSRGWSACRLNNFYK
jgi:hypothetical protein